MARLAKDYKDDTTKPHAYYDYSLVFLTLFLACFGLIMIYSASSYKGQISFGDSMHFLKRQGICVILGVIAMIVISKIDYRIYARKLKFLPFSPSTCLYLLAVALQALVLVVGEEYNGAKRWIEVAGIQFQPSEISKIATILFVSYIIFLAPRRMNKFSGFLRVCIYTAPLLVLIAKENLSAAIIVAGILFVICFVASRRKWYYVLAGIGAVGAICAAIFLVGYRSTRIDAWVNVETHPKGYQTLQGLYAIASGGLFGTGLGQSMQKLGKIPESYNDMIFTIICEELGLFGAIVVILLFALLLWRIFIVAISAPDLYGSLICVGVLAQIAIQVILNIAVVTNTIPNTGVALPFISYGGTSVAILLAEMGLVLSVSNQIEQK